MSCYVMTKYSLGLLSVWEVVPIAIDVSFQRCNFLELNASVTFRRIHSWLQNSVKIFQIFFQSTSNSHCASSELVNVLVIIIKKKNIESDSGDLFYWPSMATPLRKDPSSSSVKRNGQQYNCMFLGGRLQPTSRHEAAVASMYVPNIQRNRVLTYHH